MDSKKLLSKIKVEDIVRLLTNRYQIEMAEDIDMEAYHFKTMCHHEYSEEASFKLYLYKDSKQFHCYSGCGQMSLYDFVMTMEDIKEFSEAVEFVQNYFKIGMAVRGFGRKEEDYEIKEYKKKEVDFNEVLMEYDQSILNTFINYHAIEWIEEGISDKTMSKYEIKFDINTNSIIIPHRDVNNRLVGIRQRNFDKRQVEILKRKYVPHSNNLSRIMYRHPLGKNLYGLNFNKDKIRETGKCILWESEKSTLKMDTIYGDNPSTSCGGSTISDFQLNLLKLSGCKDIYVAYDNEIEKELKDDKWIKKMERLYDKIVTFGFNCFIIKDWEQKYLDNKDSPIDKGREVFEILLKSSQQHFVDIK